MALIQKLKRILKAEFPPPAKISLRDEDGIVGVVTSSRFRNMDTIDRLNLIEKVLEKHQLSAEEKKQILVLVAVTPEEETAHSATID